MLLAEIKWEQLLAETPKNATSVVLEQTVAYVTMALFAPKVNQKSAMQVNAQLLSTKLNHVLEEWAILIPLAF